MTSMHQTLAVGLAMAVVMYLALQLLLRATQSKIEPRILEFTLPFFDSAIGILKHRANYLANLRLVMTYHHHLISSNEGFRNQHHASIHTLRMPFQRLYVLHDPHLIQVIQSKANATTFIPNLLDFGMLFSGLNKDAQGTLRKVFGLRGNSFTMSVHKYLLSGISLTVATRAAVDRLSASLPNNLAGNSGGLLEVLRHELTLAMTGAIYGSENPYDDPQVESSWLYVFSVQCVQQCVS